jgi:1-acyl-sn-glycerol-3-phosphate acyltransferase
MKKLHLFFLTLLGWRFRGGIPKGIKKCVLIGGLHTSYWDFLYGKLGMGALGIKTRYFIKKELFIFPLNHFFKATGGIAVDRSKRTSLVDQMIDYFNASEELVLTISPEGTRSYNPDWKKGFYYIAQGAKVPIVMGYMDYKKKEIYVGELFEPTNNFEKDIETIKAFYKQVTPKYPALGIR